MNAARFVSKFRSWFDPKAAETTTFPSVVGLETSAALALLASDLPNKPENLKDLLGSEEHHYQAKFPAHIAAYASELDGVTADRLTELRFTLAAEPEVRFNSEIDWQFDPTPDPARRWAQALNRHYWLLYLAEAYQTTAQERYATVAGQLLLHWVEHNPPPPTKDERNVAWTLMGVGIRAMVWPDALQIFCKSENFRESAAPRLLLSLHDHATFLTNHQTHLNHLLREANGLLHLALRFPEFAAAAQWRQTASSRLQQEIKTQVQNDGSHIELSPAYQWLVVEEFESTLRICELSSGHPEIESLKSSILEALHRLYAYLAGIATPAGTWPQIKEGFYPPQEQLRSELLNASTRTTDSRLEWVATKGTKGRAPEETTRIYPDAGTVIFRNNWSTTAHYVIFQNGALGGPHGHEDALSIELWAGGIPFLVDPGTSSYNRIDPFRIHFTSSNAHNTVTVNKMSQVRRWAAKEQWWTRQATPELVFDSSREDLSWVTGSYTGGYARYDSIRGKYSRASQAITHRRQIIFVRNSYW